MKTILLHQFGMAENQLFNPNNRDNCNDPYILLRQRLRDRGYDFRTIDDYPVDGAEWVLFFDAPSVYPPRIPIRASLTAWLRARPAQVKARDVYSECVRAGLEQRMILFLWEPAVVDPRNLDAALHDRFPLIATWHDGYAGRAKYRKFLYPQPKRFGPVQSRRYAEKKLLVNVSGNKRSAHPRELYSERRASIRHFERTCPDQFDLYGVGWKGVHAQGLRTRPSRDRAYPSYRGTVSHKWEVYPLYRFGLCYENMRDEPGYITEKIFDCLRSDCVPVYWGASNISDYIPADAFIDRRLFPSNGDLERFLVDMPEAEYSRMREAATEYLAGSQFHVFTEEHFVENVLRMLQVDGA